MATRICLIRHGRSEWNITGRFTGWTDIPLNASGIAEAARAGERLAQQGMHFAEAHVSVLQRARQTAGSLLAAMRHQPIPLVETWRLNERHYGKLQGLSKAEIFSAWGEANYRRWWRGYYDSPPALDMDDPRHPRFDPRYAVLDPALLPCSESLRDCQQRLLPWWFECAEPALRSGKSLLVVSHGNTLRSLVMHLDRIAADEIEKVEIPSGVPLVYRFDEALNVLGKEWLV